MVSQCIFQDSDCAKISASKKSAIAREEQMVSAGTRVRPPDTPDTCRVRRPQPHSWNMIEDGALRGEKSSQKNNIINIC